MLRWNDEKKIIFRFKTFQLNLFKVNGKQKAYVINQNEMPTANPEELTRFNRIIQLVTTMLLNRFY